MPLFKVKYYAATYNGIKTVHAEDEEEAIAKVRAWVQKQMTLPMYSDGYKVIEEIKADIQ